MFIFPTVEFVEVFRVLIALIVTLLKIRSRINMLPLSPVLDKLVLCDTEAMHCSVRKL